MPGHQGSMVQKLVTGTLQSMGIKVIDIGLSTSPTTGIAVVATKSSGGITITASHNPIEWNALKLLNQKGELLSKQEYKEVIAYDPQDFCFPDHSKLLDIDNESDYIDYHISLILKDSLVDASLIKESNFKIAIDCVNSVGSKAIPKLLNSLGVSIIKKLHCNMNGLFPHNPEPLQENLDEIASTVRNGDYDLGIVVDPDVDRLALINEDGSFFGEEYVLVSIADYVLSKSSSKIAISNIASTQALREVVDMHNGKHYYSEVGEANVVKTMKDRKAIIGGEGSGGIVYPPISYRRDALIAIALFLTHLAKEKTTMTRLKKKYPYYKILKEKITIDQSTNMDSILQKLRDNYKNNIIDNTDGLKIYLKDNRWIYIRQSNTEPVLRIYIEASTLKEANRLYKKTLSLIED